jgi:adenylate cyclase
MISEAVFDLVKNTCFCRELDVVAVKGRSQSTRIFELISDHVGIISWELRKTMKTYEDALALYVKGDFFNALQGFKKYAESRPTDKAAKVLMERCELNIQSPPKDWNGVFQLQHK